MLRAYFCLGSGHSGIPKGSGSLANGSTRAYPLNWVVSIHLRSYTKNGPQWSNRANKNIHATEEQQHQTRGNLLHLKSSLWLICDVLTPVSKTWFKAHCQKIEIRRKERKILSVREQHFAFPAETLKAWNETVLDLTGLLLEINREEWLMLLQEKHESKLKSFLPLWQSRTSSSSSSPSTLACES